MSFGMTGKNGISFSEDRSSVTVLPGPRSGVCYVPSSKSQAHRLLICAALYGPGTVLEIRDRSEDIDATVSCLRAMGSDILLNTAGNISELSVDPIRPVHNKVVMDVGESGSTLRFLLPVVCALGIDAIIKMKGRLPERPIEPLVNALGSGGATIEKNGSELTVSGRLRSGDYTIPGNISSQFISGMLFALPLLEGTSTLTVCGGVESRDYISLTEEALSRFGVRFEKNGNVYTVPKFTASVEKNADAKRIRVEGDWSGAAFLLCMGALSEKGITVKGVDAASKQGDKRIIDVLRQFGADVNVSASAADGITVKKGTLQGIELDAAEIPDMVPAVCALAALSQGTTRITGASRLRLKESDRIRSTAEMIRSLGGNAEETSDGIIIEGTGKLAGGSVNSYSDHRIAMAAAVAASGTGAPVTISNPDCVSKSFPGFWDVLENELDHDSHSCGRRGTTEMSLSYGENIKLNIFGQSHAPEIGMKLEGIPAGFHLDEAKLLRFMERRAPGRNAYSTPRKEADIPEFQSGIEGGVTTGATIKAVIKNTNVRSSDYSKFRNVPRPGHADYTAYVKYGRKADMSGGGQFSGRLTAPLCIAGGICIQLLEAEGIRIISRVSSIGNVHDEGELTAETSSKAFPTVSIDAGERMIEEILTAKRDNDSVGGVVECSVLGLPAGLGGPIFEGMENRIASIIFAIPAVKGIEFGSGFGAAALRGSENNDPFMFDEEGRVVTKGNNAGGILGGITNGMPLTFKVAFKPTPSIGKEQESIDLSTGKNTTISVEGRHDPCIVPRAVPCVEAAAAVAIYDAFLGRKNGSMAYQDLAEYRKCIDEIDSKLLALFEKRMETVEKVAEYKIEHGIKVLDRSREQEKLAAVAEKVPAELSGQAEELMELLFKLSRSYQEEMIARRGEKK